MPGKYALRTECGDLLFELCDELTPKGKELTCALIEYISRLERVMDEHRLWPLVDASTPLCKAPVPL